MNLQGKSSSGSGRRLVLGVDPGTATTGYGLVGRQGESLVLLKCGVIQTQALRPLPLRLQQLHNALAEIIGTWMPTEAAVEELFFSRNARTALAVGHARGVVLLTLAQSGIPVSEYTPMQVKQSIVSYGKGSKRQVQEMVRFLLGLDTAPEPDDAADAVAIAICHLHSLRFRELVEIAES